MDPLDRFVEYYQHPKYWWESMDQILLEVCKKSPGHTDFKDVYAKVMLINRAYRAGLGRGRGCIHDDVEWRVAKQFVEQETDAIIAPLRTMTHFDRASLPVIIDVHGELVRIIRDKVTKCNQTSFVSKYLSFHTPDVFPIFDKNSYTTAWHLAGNRVASRLHKDRINWDYALHCEAVLTLVETLRDRGIPVRLKLVDCVLYLNKPQDFVSD